MTQPSGWRPAQAMRLGLILLAVGAVLLLGLMLLTALQASIGGLIIVIVPVALGTLVAALFLLFYSRRLRREQRPEWLETQAWRQGLQDKLQEKPPGRGSQRGDPAG